MKMIYKEKVETNGKKSFVKYNRIIKNYGASCLNNLKSSNNLSSKENRIGDAISFKANKNKFLEIIAYKY